MEEASSCGGVGGAGDGLLADIGIVPVIMAIHPAGIPAGDSGARGSESSSFLELFFVDLPVEDVVGLEGGPGGGTRGVPLAGVSALECRMAPGGGCSSMALGAGAEP